MITTAIKVAIIKATIFGNNNNNNNNNNINNNKTEFYQVKVSHLNLLLVATKNYLKCPCNTRCDTNKQRPKVVKHAQTLSSTFILKGAYVLRVLHQLSSLFLGF